MVVLLLGAGSVPGAEPATAPYAGAQLRLAEETLQRARTAFATHDYVMGRRLAAQAALDARLTWSMTQSAVLRSAAAALNRQAERLRSRSLIAGGGPAATASSSHRRSR
jgi:hypothetical protein